MANGITGCRILFSLMLVFTPALSPAFIAVYLLAGFTDMIDGPTARMTHTAGPFGAKLDTIADMCFFLAAAYRLLPVLRLPLCLWLWAGGIAVIKAVNIIAGFALHREFPAVHSVTNKAAGLLLFLYPLTISFLRPAYGAVPVCLMATLAAIQEGVSIRKR